MLYLKRKDFSIRKASPQCHPFTLNPNQKLDNFFIAIVEQSVLCPLSLEAQGASFGLLAWSNYWASGKNIYQNSPNFSPKNVKFWEKTFGISPKKMQKIAHELEQNSLVKLTEDGLILLWNFHYKGEKP